MMDAPFMHTDRVVVRVPLLQRARARDTWFPAVDEETADHSAVLVARIAQLASDPLLREAVEVASPDLARQVDVVLSGHDSELHRLRRILRALIAYQLRAAGRPTPFGLFAAVGLAIWSEEVVPTSQGAAVHPSVRRKGVRPDRGWLAHTVRAWEIHSALPPHVRLVANDLCVVRGEHLILPAAVPSRPGIRRGADTGTEPASAVRRTLRLTDPVRAALDLARRPVRHDALVEELASRFALANPAPAAALIKTLISSSALLTELSPPLHSRDPLGHVLAYLHDAHGPEDNQETDRMACRKQDSKTYDSDGRVAPAALSALERAIHDYSRQPLGEGIATWRAANAITEGPGALHVDTILDTPLVLPTAVARDLEEAAEVLWRLSPKRDDRLAGYHQAFLSRFGTDTLVPLTELLDPAMGLGSPPGYLMPPGPDTDQSPAPSRSPVRDHLLAHLVARMGIGDPRGTGEIVIDEALLRSCERRAAMPAAAPDEASGLSIELYAQLIAASEHDLSRGEYRVVLLPDASTLQAGAGFGRFAHHFAPEAFPYRPPADINGPEPTQVSHGVLSDRLGNVAQVPLVLPRRIAVGVFPDASLADAVDLTDLEIGADHQRFTVFSRRLGRELAPTVFHLLNQHTALPNPVRFLLDAALFGRRTCQPWDWGQLDAAPYLPAVRWGRVVLSEARWRLDDPELRYAAGDRGARSGGWQTGLDAWRATWLVPDHVLMGVRDQRLPLNLTVPEHLDLLRRELRDQPGGLRLYPALHGTDMEAGWLRDGSGGYNVEIVVPLMGRRGDVAREVQVAPSAPPRLDGETVHLPGGSWLYGRLYCDPALQDEVLRDHIASLVEDLHGSVRRWHFLRYADPRPHLRLRFHGEPSDLYGTVIGELNVRCEQLRRKGLIADLELAAYRPEVARYGGATALTQAEMVFDADSRLVLDQLRKPPGEDRIATAAIHLAHLVFAFFDALPEADDDPHAAWRAVFGPRDDLHHRSFKARRTVLTSTLTLPKRGEAGRWSPWHASVAEYARTLYESRRTEQWIDPESCLKSLMHMHCNRYLGIDRVAEADAHASARGAVHAMLDRAKALG